MTPKRQLKVLLAKLAKPQWTPFPTSRYLINHEGNEGDYNLYWVLKGRPSGQKAGEINRSLPYWNLARHIGSTPTSVGPVRETVVVLNAEEFWYQVIKVKPQMFTKYVPLSEWQRVLTSVKFDIGPVDVTKFASTLKKA